MKKLISKIKPNEVLITLFTSGVLANLAILKYFHISGWIFYAACATLWFKHEIDRAPFYDDNEEH